MNDLIWCALIAALTWRPRWLLHINNRSEAGELARGALLVHHLPALYLHRATERASKQQGKCGGKLQSSHASQEGGCCCCSVGASVCEEDGRIGRTHCCMPVEAKYAVRVCVICLSFSQFEQKVLYFWYFCSTDPFRLQLRSPLGWMKIRYLRCALVFTLALLYHSKKSISRSITDLDAKTFGVFFFTSDIFPSIFSHDLPLSTRWSKEKHRLRITATLLLPTDLLCVSIN